MANFPWTPGAVNGPLLQVDQGDLAAHPLLWRGVGLGFSKGMVVPMEEYVGVPQDGQDAHSFVLSVASLDNVPRSAPTGSPPIGDAQVVLPIQAPSHPGWLGGNLDPRDSPEVGNE